MYSKINTLKVNNRVELETKYMVSFYRYKLLLNQNVNNGSSKSTRFLKYGIKSNKILSNY